MIHIILHFECIVCIFGEVCMIRTNVVLDEKKLKAAKKAFDISTTKDLLDFALDELLKMQNRKDILNLKGKVKVETDLNTSRKTGS